MVVNSVKINKKLVEKYKNYAYMYAQYPHQGAWVNEINENDLKKSLINLSNYKANTPSMLYLHIPFCPQICHYCSCFKIGNKNYANVEEYISNLSKEINFFHDFFKENGIDPNIQEIHLGGGSPTYLKNKEFDFLIEHVKKIADFSNINEFAIEIDPRQVNPDKMQYYRNKGINRISFGIQDFNLDVQKAVNRVQPPELMEKLLDPKIRKDFDSVSFDILYGLPKQTRESFRKTMEKVIEFSPDRVIMIRFNYDPKSHPNQRLIKPNDIPNALENAAMFEESIAKLMDKGYKRIGLEHFVKPKDRLYELLKEDNLNWNMSGYDAGNANKIIGVGLGSSSRITDDYYFRNENSLKEYKKKISNGKFPIASGWKLNKDDKIRRDVTIGLRSRLKLNFSDIEKKYDINFNEYFKSEIRNLSEFTNEKMIELNEGGIKVTEQGMPFVSFVCRNFDVYT